MFNENAFTTIQIMLQDPVPNGSWKEVLNATTSTRVCYQHKWPFERLCSIDLQHPFQTEDCLILNVYVPKVTTS